MSAPTLYPVTIYVSTAADSDEERHVHIPMSGEWRLDSAVISPSTTTAADATNYASITLKRGAAGTAVSSALTTATVALTKGTARAFSLTGTALDFTGGDGSTDCLEVAVTHPGTGAAVDAQVCAVFRRIRD
jgi:hypothetical protein